MCTRCAFITGVAAALTAPSVASAQTGDPQSLEIAMPHMRRISNNLWLGQLTPNVWIHTTTHKIDSGYYPANGAIVIDGAQSILIDTAWSDGNAVALLAEWQRQQKPPITKAVATHFHADRTGGIRALAKHGIPTYGNPLTIGLALDNDVPPPLPIHDLEKHAQRLNNVEAFYPGEGHTLDNIVVYIPSDRVLFGGCLVKSTTAPDLGYTEDSNLKAWPATMHALTRKYNPTHVIPGHGTISGNSLAYTTTLAIAGARATN
jgi:glyoxylase-like metal-dependent hydrolase (beta-lactamase superfamily II)